jgi:Anti-sigma factor NepR
VSTENARKRKPTIGRHAQDRIGRELAAMYGPVLSEALPDEFLALLRALTNAEAAQDRLLNAVLDLREANKDFGLSPTRSLTMPLSVRGQQVLLARAMLHWSRKGPTGTQSVTSGSRLHPKRATSRRAS